MLEEILNIITSNSLFSLQLCCVFVCVETIITAVKRALVS